MGLPNEITITGYRDLVGAPWSDWFNQKKAEIQTYADAVDKQKTALNKGNELWDAVTKVLRNVGFPESVLPFATAQAFFESNGFKSHVGVVDHNYSGIKFLNKPYQKNATRGIKSNDGGYYAHFHNMADWAKDFKRIVSLRNVKTRTSNGGPAAIDATDLADYVHRLKVNSYFGAPEQAYYNGLKLILAAHSNIPAIVQQADEAKKIVTDAVDRVEHPFTSLIPTVPTYVKVGGLILLTLVVIKVMQK